MSDGTEQPKAFDAGDPSAVARRKKEMSRRETMKLDAFKSMMAHPGGRLWMWDFLSSCGIYITSAKDGFETNNIVFNEGQRNVGLRLFAELHKHCAGDYAKMVNEAQSLEEPK